MPCRLPRPALPAAARAHVPPRCPRHLWHPHPALCRLPLRGVHSPPQQREAGDLHRELAAHFHPPPRASPAAAAEPQPDAHGGEERTRAERLRWMLMGAFAEIGLIGALGLAAEFMGLRVAGALLTGGLVGGVAYKQSFDGSKPEEPLPPARLPHAAVLEEQRIPLPSCWVTKDATDVHSHRITIDPTSAEGAALYRQIEDLLQHTSSSYEGKPHGSCLGIDFKSGELRAFKVVKVERIENYALWKAYWHKKRELVDHHYAHNVRVRKVNPATRLPDFDKDGLLDPALNECFLFHGTSAVMVPIIADSGYDERVATLKGGFGAGIYFADQGCKAKQYASKDPANDGLRVLLINRVLLGDPACVNDAMRRVRRPPERGGDFAPGVTFDSVMAKSFDIVYGHPIIGSEDSQVEHREVVIYDHRQVYPEFIVWFSKD
ncbi:hypothetical protein AB1Y20_022488 [Prymnesium parvum]|uniref:Poly [ADP-ribose] polymerase n=1 Tax=Prymnesium parvum TaxID=97485 RepID=A0AB34JJ01_PRYPA